MSFDYTEIATDADELLTDFGAPATLKRVTAGGYDPETSTTTSPSTAEWTSVGVKLDYEQKQVDSTLIRRGDQRILLSVINMVNPQTGDTLTIGTDVFNVIESRPLQPALVPVLFDVQVRGVRS
jgi:hypothetical protein